MDVSFEQPIPMVLYCPMCGVQHIDAPEPERLEAFDSGAAIEYIRKPAWANPPHKSHLCHACGTVWRPADVCTTGIEAVATKGKADTWTGPRNIAQRIAAVSGRMLTDDQVEWVVNSLGELGVKIGQQFFFLYKGSSLVYKDAVHESDGTPMLWRMVGKREFGEVCLPLSWIVAGRREDRYAVNLTYHPGLSFGKPEDGDWKPLPAAPHEAGDA